MVARSQLTDFAGQAMFVRLVERKKKAGQRAAQRPLRVAVCVLDTCARYRNFDRPIAAAERDHATASRRPQPGSRIIRRRRIGFQVHGKSCQDLGLWKNCTVTPPSAQRQLKAIAQRGCGACPYAPMPLCP